MLMARGVIVYTLKQAVHLLKESVFNHVAVTFNRISNIANLYINGEKQFLRPAAVVPLSHVLNVSGIDLNISSAAANSNGSSTSPFQIGGAPEDLNTDGNTSEHFTGDIAVTKIFNYAFTQQQVNNDIQTYYYLLTTSSFNFTATANGGLFFPWGYPIQRRSYDTFLGNFKGDLTLTIASDEKEAYINYLRVVNGAIIHTHTQELIRNLDDEEDADLLAYAIPLIRERFNSLAPEIIIPFELPPVENQLVMTVPKIGDKRKLLELSQKNVQYYQCLYHSISVPGRTKNCISICSNSRIRIMNWRAITSFLKAFPI